MPAKPDGHKAKKQKMPAWVWAAGGGAVLVYLLFMRKNASTQSAAVPGSLPLNAVDTATVPASDSTQSGADTTGSNAQADSGTTTAPTPPPLPPGVTIAASGPIATATAPGYKSITFAGQNGSYLTLTGKPAAGAKGKATMYSNGVALNQGVWYKGHWYTAQQYAGNGYRLTGLDTAKPETPPHKQATQTKKPTPKASPPSMRASGKPQITVTTGKGVPLKAGTHNKPLARTRTRTAPAPTLRRVMAR